MFLIGQFAAVIGQLADKRHFHLVEVVKRFNRREAAPGTVLPLRFQ